MVATSASQPHIQSQFVLKLLCFRRQPSLHLVEPHRSTFRCRFSNAATKSSNAQDICRYIAGAECYCETKEIFSISSCVDRTNDWASEHLNSRNLEAEVCGRNRSQKTEQTNYPIHFLPVSWLEEVRHLNHLTEKAYKGEAA